MVGVPIARRIYKPAIESVDIEVRRETTMMPDPIILYDLASNNLSRKSWSPMTFKVR